MEKVTIEQRKDMAEKGELSEKGLLKLIHLMEHEGEETLREERMRWLSENPPPQEKPTIAIRPAPGTCCPDRDCDYVTRWDKKTCAACGSDCSVCTLTITKEEEKS